ncbi:hypothetical protein ebA3113 [Aromatoleum aromaticum EbN1]|uniref:Uncharacterized protein n=1 Tax=Aromatoleum aromaticum (strain DSM 19018 / LMG 30748 / EbN1) TaxID=76114 RepID=Q5P493_AROAE|nr:hypothetical protein ebA3113 [Aromatoleum aromaticum EbN1]
MPLSNPADLAGARAEERLASYRTARWTARCRSRPNFPPVTPGCRVSTRRRGRCGRHFR